MHNSRSIYNREKFLLSCLPTQVSAMTSLFAGIPSWIIPTLIGFVSVISLTLIIERVFTLTQGIQSLDQEEQKTLLKLIADGKQDDAVSFCDLRNHPAYRVINALLVARLENRDIKFAAEDALMREQTRLERFLPSLGTISTVAPLIGLLGTVTGMIKSFRAFEQSTARSSQLMGGIDEALITTALGLIVAIPSLVMYNFFVRKVQTISSETELLMNLVLQNIGEHGVTNEN